MRKTKSISSRTTSSERAELALPGMLAPIFVGDSPSAFRLDACISAGSVSGASCAVQSCWSQCLTLHLGHDDRDAHAGMVSIHDITAECIERCARLRGVVP